MGENKQKVHASSSFIPYPFTLIHSSFNSSSPRPFMPLSIHHALTHATATLTTEGIPNPRLDAELLLVHTLGLTRAGLYARLQEVISEADVQRFHQLLHRRQQREPLQYITGVQEFWSLEFTVTPDVLIPRPETELVVETALRLLSQSSVVSNQYSVFSKKEEKQEARGKRQEAKVENPSLQSAIRLPPPSGGNPLAPSVGGQSTIRIFDAGTGSGCIAIALAKELPGAEVWAVDVSSAALAVAQENAQQHDVAERVRFLQGDLFIPLQNRDLTFDLIVSNPPYIVHSEIHTLQPEIRNWEPRGALDGGHDGLDFYRRLLSEGPQYLRSGGWLVMEIGQGQGTEVMRLARRQPALAAASCKFDYAGCERVVLAQKR